jgi:hypothetical protein
MTKYLYKGMTEEAKSKLRTTLVAQMQRPESLFHQSYGSEAGRARNNAHRDAAWERLKKQRLKEIEDGIVSRDSELTAAGFTFPKGEVVDVDFDKLPKGKPRDQAREKLTNMVDCGELCEVKPEEKKSEPEKSAPPAPKGK